MEELCQPTLNGRGGPIAPIAIQATIFGLKNDMIQQVQNSCQFHGILGDDANKHLDKFFHVTQSIKVNGVIDDAFRLYLFPHSLTHHATVWFYRLPRNSINTFEQIAKMFLGKYFPPSMMTKHRNEITNFRQRPDESLFEAWEHYKLSIDRCGIFMKRRPEECYNLIENMTTHHNDWDTYVQRSESSSSITSSSDLEIVALKARMEKINKNLMKVLQINQQVKAVAHNCETCAGPHSYNDCPATVGQTQNVYTAGAYNQGGNSYQPQGNNHGIPQENNQGRNQFFQGAIHGQNPPPAYQAPAYQAPGYQAPTNMTSLTNSNLELKNMFGQFMKMNTVSSSGLGTLPSNTITNPKEDLKGITTRSGNAYQGPTIPNTFSSLPKVVERETEVTKDTVPPINNESTKDVQPPIVQVENQIPNSKPIVAPVVAPVSAPKPNQKPSIPYLSRLHDQKLRDKTNDQKDKFFKIFQDLDFNISFADALILMPKFGPTIKSLLTNEEKLFELAKNPLNEHCSVVLLKKLPEKLRGPCLYGVLSRSSWIFCEWQSYSIYEPTVSNSSPTLTPFEDSDFLLEETDAFLAIDDEPISPKIDGSYYDSEGDIILLEEFLNDDPSPPPFPPQELKEKRHFMVKEGIVLGHKISKNGIEVDKANVDVIAKLPHPTTVKGIRSFLGHVGFYRRFIQDFSKMAWPMTRLLKKYTPFFFSKECVEAFQKLKRKLIEAPNLVAPDWDLPFELMCNASNFAIGVVLGQ
nr:reverse transcriptase domain-containing protein [Tanacetum cinerariifolium]